MNMGTQLGYTFQSVAGVVPLRLAFQRKPVDIVEEMRVLNPACDAFIREMLSDPQPIKLRMMVRRAFSTSDLVRL